MIETLIRKQEQRDAEASRAPHLSYSRIQKYLTCPEQYRLYYVESLRAKIESASLAFGSIVHLALAEYFKRKTDPLVTFKQQWEALRNVELRFSRRESWETLRSRGEQLLQMFANEHSPKLGNVIAVEKPFEVGLSNVYLPFVGTIDLLSEIKGKRTIVEFKTAAADYEDFEVALLDQLTAYHLAEPEAEQGIVCCLAKTKEPSVNWHVTQRAGDDVLEYASKLESVAGQIQNQHFYKRPGKWCRQCDFLPVCLGNKQKANETLIKIA